MGIKDFLLGLVNRGSRNKKRVKMKKGEDCSMKPIAVIEVLAGATILLVSIVNYYRLLKLFREKTYEHKIFSKLTYGLCFALMASFLVGYIVLGINYRIDDEIEISDLLGVTLFLLGSVFVYVVINVQDQMLKVVRLRTEELIRSLINAVEAKDEYTRGHSVHVSNLTKLFYRYLPDKAKKRINYTYLLDAALLHDVGKIGIPDHILNKPGILSEDELTIVRMHPKLGKQILQQTSFKELGDIILYHHERMDGKGYYRIPASKVPLESRIIAITDMFSALYSDRVYRQRKTFKEAQRILKGVEGTHLDEELTEIFLTIPESEIDEASEGLSGIKKSKTTESLSLLMERKK